MSLLKDWNDFWFAMRPARPLAIFRIVFGLIVTSWAISIGPNVLDWFSNVGVLPLNILHNPVVQDGPRIDVLWYVSNPTILYAALGLLMISALSLALGFQTRLSALITWVLLVSFHHRNPFVFSSADTLMRLDAFYLVLAPCGRSFSIDRLIEKARNPESRNDPELVEAWGQRLMQIQLCVVYAASFMGKIPGGFWMNGTAIYYPMHMPELLRFPMTFIGNNPYTVFALTMGTMITEFAMATFIWIPRMRKYILLAGMGLHLGIEYALNIPYFSSTIIATYIVFMPDDWLDKIEAFGRRILALLPSAKKGPVTDPEEANLNREGRRAAKRSRRDAEPAGRA